MIDVYIHVVDSFVDFREIKGQLTRRCLTYIVLGLTRLGIGPRSTVQESSIDPEADFSIRKTQTTKNIVHWV